MCRTRSQQHCKIWIEKIICSLIFLFYCISTKYSVKREKALIFLLRCSVNSGKANNKKKIFSLLYTKTSTTLYMYTTILFYLPENRRSRISYIENIHLWFCSRRNENSFWSVFSFCSGYPPCIFLLLLLFSLEICKLNICYTA